MNIGLSLVDIWYCIVIVCLLYFVNKVEDIYVLTYFCQQFHNTNFKFAIDSLIFAAKDGLTLMNLIPM